MKRLLVILLALCLLAFPALAEEFPLTEALALVDAAAAQSLSEQAGDKYCGVRPMAVDASETGDAVRILGDVYLAADQLEKLSDAEYEQTVWLDRRAVVELRKMDSGWAVTSFSLDTEWEMEQAAQDYFTSMMVEYVNTELGYAIQYPAVFGEEQVEITATGIAGKIEGAAFWVECLPNEDAWTPETLLESKKQETPGAETNMDINTGMVQLYTAGEGERIVYMAFVTSTRIYQAELRYDQSLVQEFLHYAEYMINSFTADEMGNG